MGLAPLLLRLLRGRLPEQLYQSLRDKRQVCIITLLRLHAQDEPAIELAEQIIATRPPLLLRLRPVRITPKQSLPAQALHNTDVDAARARLRSCN